MLLFFIVFACCTISLIHNLDYIWRLILNHFARRSFIRPQSRTSPQQLALACRTSADTFRKRADRYDWSTCVPWADCVWSRPTWDGWWTVWVQQHPLILAAHGNPATERVTNRWQTVADGRASQTSSSRRSVINGRMCEDGCFRMIIVLFLTCQNHCTWFVSWVQCLSRVCAFQSATSMLLMPPMTSSSSRSSNGRNNWFGISSPNPVSKAI